MSVRFHPNNPIDALETIITKDDGGPLHGEINIYRKLWDDLSKSELVWDVWHDLKIPEHSNHFNYYKKTNAQIDFVILSKLGIIVMEVKGGPISATDNTFYYGKNFETPMKQNPFKQVEGYKFSLKDNVLNNLKNCFFCEVVAFPHVDYPFESRLIDPNLLWTAYKAYSFNNSIEIFLLRAITHSKNKHKKHFRIYNDLTQKECSAIKKIFSPKIGDRNNNNSINTLEWLGIQNIEILEGLYKNQRILIEGPPGSGKTTLAKAFIDKQKNKRGIYLCWNNLLMHFTKSVLNERNLSDNIEVTTFFRYFQKLNPETDYETLTSYNESEFYEFVKETISRLRKDKKLPLYDYIVVDEAQDLFDKGLDLFINSFSGYNENGLLNGNSLLFYDIDQSYSNSGRNIAELADLISTYYSHFKLNEIKRSAQNPDIRKLSSEVIDNPIVLSNTNFEDMYPNISVLHHDDLESVKKHIVKNILTPIRELNSSLRGNECIILIESTFLKGSYKGSENLNELLIIRDIEQLSETNIGDTANKLRFTSILKFKGLERKNVYLVISTPSEANKYEIYVGITRAMLNLQINVVK
jgi:GTPase SAR1 family protein